MERVSKRCRSLKYLFFGLYVTGLGLCLFQLRFWGGAV